MRNICNKHRYLTSEIEKGVKCLKRERVPGRVYGADGAVRVARHHPHRTHDLRSGSQDHHSSKNSVQKTICCNSTSNAPDDGRIYPKHVELRIHQQNYLVASRRHFKLFRE